MLPTYADQVFACRRGDLAKGIIKTNLGDFVTVTPITRRVRYGGGGGGVLAQVLVLSWRPWFRYPGTRADERHPSGEQRSLPQLLLYTGGWFTTVGTNRLVTRAYPWDLIGLDMVGYGWTGFLIQALRTSDRQRKLASLEQS